MRAVLSAETSEFHARMSAASQAFQRFEGAGLSARRGVRELHSGLQEMAREAVGATGSIGRVAAGLLNLSGTSLGVVAGFAAIGYAIHEAYGELDKAQKKVEEFGHAFEGAAHSPTLGPLEQLRKVREEAEKIEPLKPSFWNLLFAFQPAYYQANVQLKTAEAAAAEDAADAWLQAFHRAHEKIVADAAKAAERQKESFRKAADAIFAEIDKRTIDESTERIARRLSDTARFFMGHPDIAARRGAELVNPQTQFFDTGAAANLPTSLLDFMGPPGPRHSPLGNVGGFMGAEQRRYDDAQSKREKADDKAAKASAEAAARWITAGAQIAVLFGGGATPAAALGAGLVTAGSIVGSKNPIVGAIIGGFGSLFSLFDQHEDNRFRQAQDAADRRNAALIAAMRKGPVIVTTVLAGGTPGNVLDARYAIERNERLDAQPRLPRG